jgi:hypothetical protein
MTKAELDALAKTMGITTALTGPQRISLFQSAAIDRLATAVSDLAEVSMIEASQIQQSLDLAAKALAQPRTA